MALLRSRDVKHVIKNVIARTYIYFDVTSCIIYATKHTRALQYAKVICYTEARQWNDCFGGVVFGLYFFIILCKWLIKYLISVAS
jgi:hypothetical protein